MGKILVIAAHHDDEVYGMGGTILKLANGKNEVYTLILTDSCTSQYRSSINLDEIIVQKQEEAIKASSILGVKKVHFGNLPDMKLDTIPHIVVNEVIEKAVREIKPEVIYTHFYGDVNLDHQIVYRSTIVAARPVPAQCVKEVYCYSVPSSTEWSPLLAHSVFLPNVFCDITQFIDKKIEAIKAYQTEIRAYPHPRSVEYVKTQDLSAGLKYGIGYAEEFMLIRKLF